LRSTRVHGDARLLATHVIAIGDITPFERAKMIRDVENIWRRLLAMPLTEKQLEKGKELAREFEVRRIARMNALLEEE